MNWCKLILLLLLCPLFSVAQGTNFKKVRIDLKEKSFQKLMSTGIDFDHAQPFKGRYVDLELCEESLDLLKKLNWKYEILIEDLKGYYSSQNRPSEIADLYDRSLSCGEDNCKAFDKYVTPQNFKLGSMGGFHTYFEMLEVLDKMQSKFPHLISFKRPISSIKSHEGNEILYVRISNNPDAKQNKPEVLYTALHHAREPNSLSQMIFYMWYLLENYDRSPEVTAIINNTELYFIPCVNPDGYMYNGLSNPNGGGMWRKNKKKNEQGVVTGVDLNRNYGFNWGTDNEGSSPNPSSEVYRGEAAFSEPETQAMKEFVEAHNFTVNLNYHTHGNYLVHPWGYTSEKNPDAEKFEAFGQLFTKENCFVSGTGEETVGYRTNGDSDDWMYGEVGSKNRIFSFTPEIGKSFYPVKDDIEFLNKSVMDMNLKLPKIVRNYSEARPIALPIGLSKDSKRLAFQVTKLGFRNDQVKVVLQLDKGVTQSTGGRQSEFSFSQSTGDVDTIFFNFDLNKDLLDGEAVTFKYTVFFDEFAESTDLVLKYFRSPTIELLTDNFENEELWKTNSSWGKTNLLKHTGSYSFTDSPGELYKSGSKNFATLINPIDLSSAHKAKLKFNARWAIEKDFDYAQVQASTDGVNYQALCGKYTRKNNIYEIVYDGFQTDWVSEDIDISDFIGNKEVYIRFVMVADDLNNFDGMYIDDLHVDVVEKFSTATANLNEENELKISPNPAQTYIKISSKGDSYSIYNNLGQLIFSGNTSGEIIDVRSLKAGVYFLSLVDQKNHTIKSSKFIKQD